MNIPKNKQEFLALYGKFAFVDHDGGGRIMITGDWPAKNLIIVDLPLIGKHTVHKAIAEDTKLIFAELQALNLPPLHPWLPGPVHWDGCYCPRHKCWDPERSLSIHSWAAAIDLNAATNVYNTHGDMQPEIVKVFEAHGWVWGGRWVTRIDVYGDVKNAADYMHFQASAVY